MACLVHDPRYRSLFHGVVNELRKEKRIPVPMLRNMPNKCCTCTDIDKLTLVSVLIGENDQLMNFKNLIHQINQDKQTNLKSILALNRLENYIKENRSLTPPLPSTSANDIDMYETSSSSSSKSEDNTPVVTRKQKKPLKNGTFLFLPYQFENKSTSDVLLEDAKKLQRGRFIGRNYISPLEKQHNVCINMITSETSEQIKRTLDNTKAGIGNVKIHNQKDLSEGGEEEDGEWILVRQKKSKDQTNTTDFEALLDELKSRWDTFLKAHKRKNDDEENDARPNKK